MLEEKISVIVRRVAPHVAPGFDTSADLYRELGVKSIAALDLLLSIEEELGVSIPDEDFGEARSVDKLAALARRLGAVGSVPERAVA